RSGGRTRDELSAQLHQPASLPAPLRVPCRVRHEPFMKTALVWADEAKCTRRQVGAVLVKDGHIISTGYNGTPSGRPNCTEGGCPRGKLTYDEVPGGMDYSAVPCTGIHAEANALLRAGSRAVGCVLYVN